MTKTKILATVALMTAIGAGLWKAGLIDVQKAETVVAEARKTAEKVDVAQPPPPSITVERVHKAEFVETALVTGSLVAREELQVAPEVEGLKVLTLNFDEGDTVKKGDVLAELMAESLDTNIAEADAVVARATAAIAQAKSQIADAEARVTEADAALERARPLAQNRYLSESTLDQREAAAKSTRAQLAAAKDGLKLAEAEKVQAEAQKGVLVWRRGKTSVRAPDDGLVSRRSARIGAIASAVGEPMFRIIRRGEIELDAEVSEARLAKVREGQKVHVTLAGGISADGTVRLVSPEVEKSTRLGRVRIFLGANPALKVGAFGTGVIETARKDGLSIPQSAVLFGDDGPTVLVVENGIAKLRRIETGLIADGRIEVPGGVAEGDLVVTKAGTFLRDGDAVKPILPEASLSEVR